MTWSAFAAMSRTARCARPVTSPVTRPVFAVMTGTAFAAETRPVTRTVSPSAVATHAAAVHAVSHDAYAYAQERDLRSVGRESRGCSAIDIADRNLDSRDGHRPHGLRHAVSAAARAHAWTASALVPPVTTAMVRAMAAAVLTAVRATMLAAVAAAVPTAVLATVLAAVAAAMLTTVLAAVAAVVLAAVAAAVLAAVAAAVLAMLATVHSAVRGHVSVMRFSVMLLSAAAATETQCQQ